MMGELNVKFVEDFSMMTEFKSTRMLVKRFIRRKGLSLIVENNELLIQVRHYRNQESRRNKSQSNN